MATKTLSITEDAYERLASFKEGKESFSDVITKLTKKNSILDLVGILSPEEGRELKKNLTERRKLWRKSIERTSRKLR